jgi:hypothetical protein
MERFRGRAFLFDLDGTFVDSVFQHVLSWHEALEALGFECSCFALGIAITLIIAGGGAWSLDNALLGAW